MQWDEKAAYPCPTIPAMSSVLKKIRLKAQDIHGKSLEFEMKGFEARIAQHELDHLNGILFLDRLVSRKADLFRRKQ